LVIALRFAPRDFCEQRKLSLSRHGHSVVHHGAFYQVFMFAEEEHAEIIGLHPSRRAKEPIGRNGRTGTVTLGNDIAGSSFLNFSITFNAAVSWL
jgi:hypothetical protein